MVEKGNWKVEVNQRGEIHLRAKTKRGIVEEEGGRESSQVKGGGRESS